MGSIPLAFKNFKTFLKYCPTLPRQRRGAHSCHVNVVGPSQPRHKRWDPHSHVISGGPTLPCHSSGAHFGTHLPRQQKRAHVWDPHATSTVVEPTRGTHHGHVSSSGAHTWDPNCHVSSSGAHMWDPPAMSAVVGQQVWDPNVGATN